MLEKYFLFFSFLPKEISFEYCFSSVFTLQVFEDEWRNFHDLRSFVFHFHIAYLHYFLLGKMPRRNAENSKQSCWQWWPIEIRESWERPRCVVIRIRSLLQKHLLNFKLFFFVLLSFSINHVYESSLNNWRHDQESLI